MSARTTRAGDAAGVRRPSRLAATLFALFTLLAAAGVITLTSATDVRLDATFDRAHRPSPRALAVIDSLRDLPGEYELVLAADRAAAAASPVTRQRLDRVTDAFESLAAASQKIRFTPIDVSADAGRRAYADLVERLVERDSQIAEAGDAAIAEGITRTTELAGALRAAAPGFAGLPSSRTLDTARLASLAREIADALDAQSTATAARPRPAIPDPSMPAAGLAAALRTTTDQMEALARAVLRSLTPGPAATAAADTLRGLRDDAAIAADELARVRRPDSARIARALATGEGVLVIGPPDPGIAAASTRDPTPTVAALDLAEILGPATAPDPGAAARRAETRLTTALAALTRADAPAVVVMHAETARLLPVPGLITALRDRLAAQGIPMLEWPVALEQSAPDEIQLAAAERTLVYLAVAPDSTSSGRPDTEGPAGDNGTSRARLLAAAVMDLIEDGRPVLLSLGPSLFPTFGDDDPLAAALEPFGVVPRSGLALLRTASTTAGQLTLETHQLTPAEVGHPLSDAVRGLPMTLEWPVPLAVDPESPAVAAIVASLPANPNTWAEPEWVALWAARGRDRALVPDQPTPDADEPEPGPWPVAIASERSPSSRLVAVGSQSWFLDRAWTVAAPVDGRETLTSPGNIELLESAVNWLASRDDLLAPGPSSRAAPMIGSMSRTRATVWRWSLIAGLPLGVLAMGALFRYVKY